MLHTFNAISWDEPVVPLTARQLQAATESHEYALAQDLVLALETDDHLQFHYSVADNETRRIPTVERSLADNHLPPLVLTPVKIEELWIVPRRVAGVLEAACRWLTEEELKACEEAVVNYRPKKTTLSTVERARKLKLERPLLLADPDDDLAEQEKAATAAINCGEDCVRKHGIDQNNKDEQDLFFIPIDASIYAAHMEETACAEKMAVSEQSIRSLIALMASMEWSEKDQVALLDQQTMMPTLLHRSVSPPLPPVDDIEYFVPSGDACLVSGASDVSSGVSEALEEAERLLTEQTGEVWKDEAVDLDIPAIPVYTFDESVDSLLSQLSPFHTNLQQEPDILMPPSMSLSLSPFLSGMAPGDFPDAPTNDDELFSSWINESMLVDDNRKDDQVLQPVIGVEANTALNRAQDQVEVIKDEPGGSLSVSGSQDDIYEELTEDALFALEENEIVVQAKIPVPAVSIESSLPGWHTIGDSHLDMIRWTMKDAGASVEEMEWKDGHYLPKDDLDELITHYANLCTETVGLDERCLEQAVSWLKFMPDSQSMLIDSIKPVAMLRKVDNEEPLKIPEDKPEEPSPSEVILLKNEATVPKETAVAEEVVVDAPRFELKAPGNPLKTPAKSLPKGQSDRKQIQHDVDTAWSNLMNRHKKRKKAHTPSSSLPASTAPQMGQSTVSTKAPELILGLRAFAEPPGEEGEQTSSQDVARDGAVQQLSTAQASTIVIEKGPTVQPLDIGSVDLPKAIMSTAISRTLRTFLLQLLPTLEFVERDYKQLRPGFEGIDTSNEADLVVSPSTGVIMSTMVGLRQTDAQNKKPVFQSRVSAVAPRYKTLHILIYRNNARPIQTDDGTTIDDLPELSPSDAMALAQLQGFVRSLPCSKVSVSYIGGGEQAVAEWGASLMIKEASKEEGRGKRRAAVKYLLEEENQWELFFRKAGFNVYDAQIVLGVLGDSVHRTSPVIGARTRHTIRTAMGMPAEGRLKRLESMVGCQTAMVAFRLLSKDGPVGPSQRTRLVRQKML